MFMCFVGISLFEMGTSVKLFQAIFVMIMMYQLFLIKWVNNE